MMSVRTAVWLSWLGICAIDAGSMASAQGRAEPGEVFGKHGAASGRITQPRGSEPKTIDFDVDEGTNVSLDVSPHGGWLVFDLLGHLYRVDAGGGNAQVLTQDSGVALNITPAVSPDGRRIAFASDRSGQLNLWVMDADGSAPVALTNDDESRYIDPSWAPDGRSVAAVRRSPVRGHGVWFPRTEIWSIPVDGSTPRALVKPANDSGLPAEQFGAPSFSPDGRFLYFQRSVSSFCAPGFKSSRYRLQRLELASGHITDVRPPEADAVSDCETERLRTANETEPHVSPDGRFLAFTLTSARDTFSYRGHDFRPGTALVVRDLASGAERRIASPIASAMTHGLEEWSEIKTSKISWSADGKRLLYMASGHIQTIAREGGKPREVPFRANVHRVMSQQLKPRRSLDTTDSFSPALLQWPSSSADGQSLVFIAAGRLYLARRGAPAAPLLEDAAVGKDAFLYTPSWSPSGDEVAFASWDAKSGGHIWRYRLRTGKLQQVTQAAGRYLYPVWANDGRALAYLHNPAPRHLTVEMFFSPFDEGTWNVVVADADGKTRTVAETARPHQMGFGTDGRLRYLRYDRPPAASSTGAPAGALPGDALAIESLDPRTLTKRVEMKIVPAPWQWPGYWPETQLSADGKWLSLVLSDRAFACEVSRIAGPQRLFDIETAASLDACKRIDQHGAWFSRWRDEKTIEYTDGRSQIRFDVERGERGASPVSVTVERPGNPELLLRNATLIPFDGGRVSRRGDILIVGRRIACVGECAATAQARVIDLTGKFVMPGIIDTHNHTTRFPGEIVYPGDWKTRATLAFGVTTRYDPFTRTKVVFPLSDLTESGRIVGPRTYGSADVIYATSASGGPVAYFDYEWPLNRAADAAFEVARRARFGAPILKYYWPWNRAQAQLLMDAARADGTVNVTSEGMSLHQELAWVMDGQPMFEHMLPGLPIYRDVTEFMGRAGLIYTPTLIAVETAYHFRAEARVFPEVDYESFASRDIVDGYIKWARPFAGQSWQELPADIQSETAKDISAYGGTVSVGAHGEMPGLAEHLEIWMLSTAMGPAGALRAATVNGAIKLGLQSELGSIETGKAADLIVLDADPLENIRNTVKIDSVVKSGALYPRSQLRSVADGG